MSSTLYYRVTICQTRTRQSGNEEQAISPTSRGLSTRPFEAAMFYPAMSDLGRILISLGVLLLVAGAVVLLLGRTSLPLGRLPGDFLYRGKNSTFYFPLATSILLSVVLSLLLYVISRIGK